MLHNKAFFGHFLFSFTINVGDIDSCTFKYCHTHNITGFWAAWDIELMIYHNNWNASQKICSDMWKLVR